MIPLVLVFLIFTVSFVSAQELAQEGKLADRYFLSGDGVIQLANARNGMSARIRYRLPDGAYQTEARRQIDRLFGVSAAANDSISLRFISVLDYFEDRFQQPITILSGYRSPSYNTQLRTQGRLAAKASLHMEGMAADIRLPKSRAARAFGMMKELQCCGVGFYHGNSLHLDTGPARFWDETSSKVGTDISDHNKRIMVRTDQDIYVPGETVELRLARITEYPIGFSPNFAITRDGQTLHEFSFDGKKGECVPVTEPQERRTEWTIPDAFQTQGRVTLQLRFCDKPFPEMPDRVESNPIVIQQRE